MKNHSPALSGRLNLFICILAFLPALLLAQINATFIDINPNNSSLDNTDPNGATGGRVNNLANARDGSAYYAATEWGGLYRSNDTGRNWFRLNGHRPVATWDVEVAPNDNNRIYATSFYDGRVNSLSGINVSTDGGTTWTKPATATPPTGSFTSTDRRNEPSAFGIAIDPANNNNVYIGTNSGLAISNNAGATWRFVDPTPGDGADNVWDVVVHHGGIIDIVGDDGHCRSTDGGVSWTVPGVLMAGRSSIAVSPDEAYVLFAAVGRRLFQTTDAGATWTEMTNPRPQGRIPFVAVNNQPGRAYDLWFGDVSLWRTTCNTPVTPAFGGAGRAPSNSWSAGFTKANGGHDDTADILFTPGVAEGACPLLYSCDGGVYFNTRTGGDCQTPAWEQPTVTPHALWPFGMSGADRGGVAPEDLYFGNQDNGIFGTTDAGGATPTWNNIECCDGFDFTSDNSEVLYTVCCFGRGRFNRLFLRGPGLTGGAEVNAYPAGNLDGFTFYDIIDQFGPDDYAVVTTAGLFVTSDINASPIVWSAELGASTSPGMLCNVKAAMNGTTPVFYGLNSGIDCDDRTPNAKQLWRFSGINPSGTWTQLTPPGAGGFGVFDVDPNNSQRIIASFLPTGGLRPRMVMSTNGGTTWQNLPQLDAMMDGGGQFRMDTRTGPSNFTGFEGYAQPSLLAFDPLEPKVIVAGAVDAGVFVSTDGGVCWKLITDPHSAGAATPHIPRPRFAYFSHLPDAGGKKIIHVYIGSQGRGVWRSELTIDGYTNAQVALTPVRPTCPRGCDGSVTTTVTGASGSVSYLWSNGQTTANATGLCTNNYSVTVTDRFGCTSATVFVPDGIDVTPPVITCPANLTQSCEVSTEPATTGTATATDACGIASITKVDEKIPGTCPYDFTLNRTWTALDNNGNRASCVQRIKVQDITKPAITCPPNITVTCDTTPAATGFATATDNCDPMPRITGRIDVNTGGFCEWFCVLERTWTAKDTCGNTNSCKQTITKNTAPLIDQALSTGAPLVMGTTNSTVTFPPGVGVCVIKMLPPTGNKKPHGLTFKKSVVSTTNCKPGTNPVDATGRIENALFGEALKMAIIAKLKPAIAAKKLSEFACPLNSVIRQSLKPEPDIAELVRVTNLVLGNDAAIPGGQLKILLEYLQCINASLDICK